MPQVKSPPPQVSRSTPSGQSTLQDGAEPQKTVQVPSHRALQVSASRHWALELLPSTTAQFLTLVQKNWLSAPVSTTHVSAELQRVRQLSAQTPPQVAADRHRNSQSSMHSALHMSLVAVQLG